MKLISKSEYKKLVDQCVELAQLKIKVDKMKDALEKKSDEIQKLQRKIRYNEYMREKKCWKKK